MSRAPERIWLYVEPLPDAPGCWLWMGATALNGYGTIQTRLVNGKRKSLYAHRVAYELSRGISLEPGIVVRHRCDVPPCIRPSHLEAGSPADNARDAAERERMPRGSNHWNGKLRPEQVVEIKTQLGAVSQLNLGRRYGVAESTIQAIADGRTWAWITVVPK